MKRRKHGELQTWLTMHSEWGCLIIKTSYYNVLMGNQESFGQDPTLSCKQIDSEPLYSILESHQGQQYQKYNILHDHSSNFQEQYHFRIANPHQDLVQVLYAGQIVTFMGCAERDKYEVVTELIPYLIESITDLRLGNALVVLKGCLRGFKDLKRRHGGIAITENMIGINQENRVKVWLNENFAVNWPEENQEDEQKMVERIFQIVGGKVEKGKLWEDLIAMKTGRNVKIFEEAFDMVEDFARRRHIHIEATVSNIFNKSYYQEKQTNNQQQQETFQYIKTENSVVFRSPARKPFQEMEEKILQSKTQPFNFTLAKQYQKVQFHTPQQRIANPLFVKADEHRHNTPFFHQPQLITRNIVSRSTQPIQIKFNSKAPEPVRFVPILSSTSPQPIQIQQRNEETNTIVEARTIQTSESSSNFHPVTQKPKEAVTVPTFSAIPNQSQPTALQNLPQCQHADTSFQKQQDQGLYTEPQSPKAEKQLIFITLNNTEYLRNQPSYEINVQEAMSQQSIHQQLTPLLTDQSAPQSQKNLQEEGRTALQVYLNNEESSLHNLHEIRTSLNPSLVDTREIKQAQPPKPEPLPVAKSLNLSYRQMRKLLLQQLQ